MPQVEARSLEEVERRWCSLCATNPAYFDGRLYHVLGVHRNGHGGATLHVIDCAYRFFAVQDDDFDVGVRPLGLKGLTVRDGRYLMGLRANQVAFYKKMWEFAPGGSMEPGASPAELISRELREETGLELVHEPVAMALIFDPVLRCWELIWRLEAVGGEPTPRRAEYDALEWRAAHDLPTPMSPIALQIAQLLNP